MALAAVLHSGNGALTALDLRGNGLRPAGAQALAKGLGPNTSLTSLVLAGNGIRDEGARALSVALRMNHTLAVLDLRGDDIRDEGAKAFPTPAAHAMLTSLKAEATLFQTLSGATTETVFDTFPGVSTSMASYPFCCRDLFTDTLFGPASNASGTRG